MMDREVIQCFAGDDIIQSLQSSPELTSAADRRDDNYYVYTLLHTQHHPVVPVSVIGRLFGVSESIVR
jgi:hypothetical protein